MFRLGLTGLNIIEDKNLVIQDGITTLNRTWKERLFTRPWKPWIATKEIANMIPNPDVFIIKGKTVLAHPATAQKIKEMFRNDPPANNTLFN